jgi:hypothetical protein
MRSRLARDKERELTQEAMRLRTLTPGDTIKIVSELTDFAIKMNRVTEGSAKEKNH